MFEMKRKREVRMGKAKKGRLVKKEIIIIGKGTKKGEMRGNEA